MFEAVKILVLNQIKQQLSIRHYRPDQAFTLIVL